MKMMNSTMTAKFINFIAACLIAVVLAGCNRNDTLKVVTLGQEIKTKAERLEPETTLTLPDLIFAKMAWVYNDRYAVLALKTRDFSTALYDMQTGEILKKFLHYGNGPQEILLALYRMVGDTLTVRDMNRGKMYLIPLAKLPDIEIIEQQANIFSAEYIPYKGKYLALNPYFFKNEKMGIDTKENMLLVSDGAEREFHDDKLLAINVVQGTLLYNKNRDRIAFLNGSDPLITIFNSELNPVVEVKGPVDYEVSYIQPKDSYELVFYGNICTSYRSAASDDLYIYALYHGSVRDARKSGAESNHYLFVFDWDGNVIKSFVLNGITSTRSTISLGNTPGSIYVSNLDNKTDAFCIKKFSFDL